MVSLHKTTSDCLRLATLRASSCKRINLEVSGNEFILLPNCNRTVTRLKIPHNATPFNWWKPERGGDFPTHKDYRRSDFSANFLTLRLLFIFFQKSNIVPVN